MAAKVHRRTVGDYVTLQRGTTYKGSLVGQPGPALLGLGSIEPGGGFRYGHYKTYGGDCPTNLMLFPGDLYAALKGATKDGKMIGSVARVPNTVSSGRLTQDTVKLAFRNPDRDTGRYLYWILRTPQYRAYCAGHAMGSAVVALSRRDFLSYPVPPPSDGRKKLVALLDALDDKIELNRRMNETLEAMARALFKSWFVDFDPVRAKHALSKVEGAEGRDPGLPKEIAGVFTDRFEDSDLGEIPAGWSTGTIVEQATLISGGTPKTDRAEYWDGGIPWASAKDVSQCGQAFLVATERAITPKGLEESATQLIPALSTVVVARGATTGRMVLLGREMAMNQTCYALKSTTATPFALHCRLRQEIDGLVHAAHGSVFDTITTRTFSASKVVVAVPLVLSAFEQQISPVFQRILKSIEESSTLAALRDTLLPKLISGELRLTDAEQLIEEVIP